MSSDEKLDEMIRRMGLLETGVQNLGARLETIERESNDIKQGIVNLGTRLEVLERDFEANDGMLLALLQSIDEKLNAMRVEMDKGFSALDRQTDSMSGSITRLQAHQVYLESRINKIEKNPS